MNEAHKRALILAYYLSRFDRKGYRTLRYATFDDAFEKIGVALDVKPSTVKHMRDSFDPYCSVVRVGWYQRPVLRSRANVMQAYDGLSELAMTRIVREILQGESKVIALYIAPISEIGADADTLLSEDNPYANRLKTGEDAEEFFKERFKYLESFKGSVLEDTRKLGIGFDFRAAYPKDFRAIEVKGIAEANGYISFTDKEWSVAQLLKDAYVLALVHSVNIKPTLELVANPVKNIKVTMRTIESVTVRWNAKV